MLVGHGSKLINSNEALNRVMESLQIKEPTTFFQVAYLEIQPPNIPQGIELCLNQGAEEVVVIPYFVQTGKHVVEDIPRIVREAQTRFPKKRIQLGEYMGFDERLVSLVLDRVHKAQHSSKVNLS